MISGRCPEVTLRTCGLNSNLRLLVLWSCFAIAAGASVVQVDEIRLKQAKAASLAQLVHQALVRTNSLNQASLPEYVRMVELHVELRLAERDLLDTSITAAEASRLSDSYREEVATLVDIFRQVGDNIVVLSRASDKVASLSMVNALFGSGWSKWALARDLAQQDGVINDRSSSIVNLAASLRERLEQVDTTLKLLAAKDSVFYGVSNSTTASLKAAEAYVVGQVGVARKEAAETKTARTDCWIGMLSLAAVAVLAAILFSAGSQ